MYFRSIILSVLAGVPLLAGAVDNRYTAEFDGKKLEVLISSAEDQTYTVLQQPKTIGGEMECDHPDCPIDMGPLVDGYEFEINIPKMFVVRAILIDSKTGKFQNLIQDYELHFSSDFFESKTTPPPSIFKTKYAEYGPFHLPFGNLEAVVRIKNNIHTPGVEAIRLKTGAYALNYSFNQQLQVPAEMEIVLHGNTAVASSLWYEVGKPLLPEPKKWSKIDLIRVPLDQKQCSLIGEIVGKGSVACCPGLREFRITLTESKCVVDREPN